MIIKNKKIIQMATFVTSMISGTIALAGTCSCDFEYYVKGTILVHKYKKTVTVSGCLDHTNPAVASCGGWVFNNGIAWPNVATIKLATKCRATSEPTTWVSNSDTTFTNLNPVQGTVLSCNYSYSS